MKEKEYDTLLHIQTIEEQEDFPQSYHYNRYEPTPYAALEKLFEHYEVKRDDVIVDFGCGKGRLNIYLNHFFDVTVTGVEMDEGFYREACDNRERYLEHHKKKKGNIFFYHGLAEEYPIKPEEDVFYFFNPFSLQIFMKVVSNILFSTEKHPRKVQLVLYYPSHDYIYFLENQTLFQRKLEVDLAAKDERECFMVYEYREGTADA